jgi:hypothetical protein
VNRASVVDLGYIVDDRKLAQAYNAADMVVLLPGRNQPNVMLKQPAARPSFPSWSAGWSMSSGTISTDVW